MLLPTVAAERRVGLSICIALSLIVSMVGTASATTIRLTPPVLAALRTARVPVLVPTTVPDSLHVVGVAVDVPQTGSAGYSLDLVYDARCIGTHGAGDACTAASIEAFQPPQAAAAGMTRVRLSDGSTGYYHSGPCGANCHGSFQLTFVRMNTTYTIAINAGTLSQALAIERGLRPLSLRKGLR